jgi:hypothetical protein
MGGVLPESKEIPLRKVRRFEGQKVRRKKGLKV